MPFALLLLIAAGVGWAWWTGRLKGLTSEDAVAGAAFLLGLRFATTGRLLVGLPLMAGAALWGLYRRGRRASAAMPLLEARQLLGVDEMASLADIREAHRRLIARVHPDKGGSAELAHRVNLARDTLVDDMNRKTPRAS
jgi:hypothetical protein